MALWRCKTLRIGLRERSTFPLLSLAASKAIEISMEIFPRVWTVVERVYQGMVQHHSGVGSDVLSKREFFGRRWGYESQKVRCSQWWGSCACFFFCGIWMTGLEVVQKEKRRGEKSLLIVTVVWKRQTTRVVTPVFLIGIATVSFLWDLVVPHLFKDRWSEAMFSFKQRCREEGALQQERYKRGLKRRQVWSSQFFFFDMVKQPCTKNTETDKTL